MRELKFRAWDKHYKAYVDLVAIQFGSNGLPSLVKYEAEDGRLFTIPAHIFIIEQYTGLKDKNGKEIYDGDIVRYLAYSDKYYIGQVAFGFVDDSEGYYLEKHYGWGIYRGGYNTSLGDYADDSMRCMDIEVIGNIHENKKNIGGRIMGRYYYSDTGKTGKFWFAVQPSTDPKDVFDMDELEYEGEGEPDPTIVDYWTDDKGNVRRQLKKQYDILGVPRDKRKYEACEESDYVWEDLLEYFLTDKVPLPLKNDAVTPAGYDMGRGKPRMYPISKEKELAASRVELGLFILGDIINSGCCSISAELC